MASSRKSSSAEAAARAFLRAHDLRGKRVAVGFSGGVDSVVLLHLLRRLARKSGFRVSAIHVHHGLSPNAAARAARYRCYRMLRADAVALGHQLDDQAETVLMNLLRGAGLAGASGMRAV